MKSLLQIMLQITMVFALVGTEAISAAAFSDAGSSYNRSCIQLNESRNISQAPAIMSVGSGYYSSRPISYDSTIGSETWIKDMSASASMNHEVSYAHVIDGEIELSAKGGSYYQNDHYLGDYYSQNISSMQMKIDEDVTEGMVHIGVLQGDGDSANEAAEKDGSGIMADAWKNPSLEMEENYIGTYHIKKNMTIVTSHNDVQNGNYWLDCCGGGYFNTEYFPNELISADDVFNYRFINT